MLKQLWTVVTILFIGIPIVNAQDCQIQLKGTVTDFHDGEPLAFAQFYIKDQQKSTTSNEEGTYIFRNLCAGEYEMIISHFDCITKTVKLSIYEDQIQNFTLEHHVNDLDQVKVIADVHDDHESTQSTTRVLKETINKYSGATLGDALATVQGVSILKTGNSVTKPVIHGLYGSRVAIVNDGMRQQDQEWGVEHAPNIDLNTAGNIQVIKGASALRYGGDAIGGTILIDPERVIVKDTLKGQLISQIQSNGRGGSVTGSLGNYNNTGWYQQATLTYKRLGDFEAPDYVLSNTGSSTYAANLVAGYQSFEYGASLKYSFYDSELGILRASHIGNAAGLAQSINSGQPFRISDFTYDIDAPKQEVQHHAVQFNGYKRLKDLGKLEVDYSFQYNNRLEFDIRRAENRDRASLDLDLFTHNLMTYLLIDRYSNTDIEIGIDGMLQTNIPNPDTGVRRLIPDYESQKVGAFASVNHELNDKWFLEAGARYDYYHIDAEKFYISTRWESLGYDQQFPQFEVSENEGQIFTNPVLDFNLMAFTVGAKYLMDDHYDFSVNLSTANRAPNPSELFSDGLHHALATIELGQLDLQKEQSYKINLTAHAVHNDFDIEINPYVNIVQDFMQLIPIGLETTGRGAFPVSQYEQVNAVLAGVDLGATWNIFYRSLVDPETRRESIDENLLLNSRFSYIYGQNTTDDEPLIYMPPPVFDNELVWENGIIDNLTLRISNTTMLKQNRFPDTDFPAEVFDDQGNSTIVNVEISETPKAYSLWNLVASYAFAKAQLNLSLNNVLNTTYRDYLNRQRFYADDIGRDIQLQFIYNF
ncbi:TonB-dependent receptor [Nonlabens marinus]|uniref:Outer membrane hemin receptor n=1 Tax=Nonlabens marinus S1-08 TaxID=1454201 RepID=W8W042_9FLAO|nr:TonB-dependent receptor [Nonlabens marinus]BAO55671.1 outer membrane hemin receptor [Nonlabens marinus S1-08]